MGRPSISVVIPTFNRGATIVAAVASALRQSRPANEVVVVDDGSTDGTVEILGCASIGADPRLRVIRLRHGERSRARNAGISQTSGELLAFLDSDDLWREDHLETQCRALEHSPAAVAAVGDYGLVDEQGRLIRKHVRRTTENGGLGIRGFDLGNDDDVRRALVLKRIIIHPSEVVARRDVVVASGCFRDTVNGAEDWVLWVHLALQGRLLLTGRQTVWLRRSSDNTFSRPQEFADSIVRAAEMVVSTGLPEAVGAPGDLVRAVADVHASIALAHGGERGIAVELLRRAILRAPRIMLDRRFWLAPRRIVLGGRVAARVRRLRWKPGNTVAAARQCKVQQASERR